MAEILNVNWNSVFENMHNILPQENDSEFSIGYLSLHRYNFCCVPLTFTRLFLRLLQFPDHPPKALRNLRTFPSDFCKEE